MENDEEKVEEDKEKLNDSMNSSPLKNGSCNNKRLRTCTSNSLEMPQSSKMKRVLSYIEEQAQEEGEHGGVAGPSTSWPTQYLHQRPAPYLHKKQTPISNNTTREEEENVAEAKFNETKVKERTEQLADFHAKFIELIQSLPLNIQMRKFLVYENA
nr:unnamed protein product [Meloidogyne enterolobii]